VAAGGIIENNGNLVMAKAKRSAKDGVVGDVAWLWRRQRSRWQRRKRKRQQHGAWHQAIA